MHHFCKRKCLCMNGAGFLEFECTFRSDGKTGSAAKDVERTDLFKPVNESLPTQVFGCSKIFWKSVQIFCKAFIVGPTRSDGGTCHGEPDAGAFDGGVACLAIAVECADRSDPVDLDGDGCALECPGDLDGGSSDAGVACPAIAVECADRSDPVDIDGDGCALECPGVYDGGVACPALVVECADRSDPVDLNGDGCALECPDRR